MAVPAKTSDFETGLEDFEMTDAVIPRITIVHKEGEFKDSLSGEQFDTLNVIMLGLVKQRVLWHPDVEDEDRPMCRSTDHENGFPNLSDEQPKAKRFPWKASGFDKADYVGEDDDGDEILTEPLACGGCALKEWGSHPDGKKPYCAEQFTIPILYQDPHDDESFVPAIVTFQKTALKPLKAYLSSFARSRNAAYQAITQMSLTMVKRGTTDYSVPVFKRIGSTDEDNYREYSMNYRTMRDFLTAAPGSREESEGGSTTVVETTKVNPADENDVVVGEVEDDEPKPAKAKKSAPKPAAKKVKEPESEPTVTTDDDEDDDDLPF